MMRAETENATKVKYIDWSKADSVRQEVCSRDEVMHVEMNGLSFSTTGWPEGEQE